MQGRKKAPVLGDRHFGVARALGCARTEAQAAVSRAVHGARVPPSSDRSRQPEPAPAASDPGSNGSDAAATNAKVHVVGNAGAVTPSRRSNRVVTSETGELRIRSFENDLRLAVVADIARALSARLTLEQLLELIMDRLTRALGGDRSTLFLCSDDGEELWSMVAQGARVHEIRIRRGQGLAGWVAATGRGVNVKDAYQDARFDPHWDVENGYRTASMLCQPVVDRDGELIGVVQVLNKQDGYFTVEDEGLLTTIMAMAAISIVNAQLHNAFLFQNVNLSETQQQLAEKVNEIDLLYRLERDVGDAQDLAGALAVLLDRIAGVVPSSLVQIALFRPETAAPATGVGLVIHRLLRGSRQIEVLSFDGVGSLASSVMAACAPADVVSVGPAQLQALVRAEQWPFTPRGGLCLPLLHDDRILGALTVLDRPGKQPGLGEGHAKLLTLISNQVARAVATRTAREQVEREERLAAIGSALAGVMHDFRTPMTIASGYVQLLQGEEDADERERLAVSVLQQLERMTKMTREVLAFARGDQTLLFRKVMLHEFAEEARVLIRQIFANSHVATEVTCRYKGPAQLDSGKLLRVVQNIARNARDALAQTYPNGSQSQPGPRFDLDLALDGEQLVLTFVDNGAGVPIAFRHRLFDAFATQGKKDGTGLGLAMVKQFAEALGGGVSYRDTPGGGATFEIRLARDPRGQHDKLTPVA